MRFDHISIHGLGPFHGTVEVDLTSIPGPLIAVTGANGSGKSTLLDLFMGALDRDTPTRGTLAELATTRDAYVEAKVVNGAAWTIRQLMDGTSGKGESLVLDEAGAPVLADGKVRSFDQWRAAHLPAREVLLASTFAAQGSGGFVEMKAGERKSCLLKALGIESLEGMADRARERVRAAKTSLDLIATRIADERRRGGDVEAIKAAIDCARECAAAADAQATRARQAQRETEAAASDGAEARRVYERRQAEAKELLDRAADLETKIADLEKRLANNRAVLADAATIRAAVARLLEVQRELTEATLDAGRERGHADQAAREGKRVSTRILEAGRAITAVEQRFGRALTVLRDRDAIEEAVAALPQRERDFLELQRAVEAADAEVEKLRGQRLTGAEERITGLRTGLTSIATEDRPSESPGEHLASVQGIARATLATDDEAVEATARFPATLKAAQVRRDETKLALRAGEDGLRHARATAARAGEIARAVEEKAAAETEERDLRQNLTELEGHGVDLTREAEDRWALLAAAEQRIAAAQREKAELEPVAKRAEPLAKAEARIAEIEPQLADHQGEAARLRTRAAEVAPAGAAPTTPDLEAARARVEQAERDARESAGRVIELEKDLADAQKSAEQLALLEEGRGADEQQLADWTLLADSLGRDGLQALIIDAAGPEITEICNSLLHEAFGTRFTISLDTTKRSADGKREIEVMDVNVIDTDRGRDGSAAALSGGEKVIIGEALSLALTTIACRQSGVERPTIFRDESGAALDPENATRYVAMLRRASVLIGADKILLVSHSQAVQEMCDSRILVGDGKAVVAQ